MAEERRRDYDPATDTVLSVYFKGTQDNGRVVGRVWVTIDEEDTDSFIKRDPPQKLSIPYTVDENDNIVWFDWAEAKGIADELGVPFHE